MVGEIRRGALRLGTSRRYIQLYAVLWPEQAQRQVDDVLFRGLTSHSRSQELSRLLLERAMMCRRSLLQPGVEGCVDIANQQARHETFPSC
jgi:hypothetical protein